jgi:hypothetical protein
MRAVSRRRRLVVASSTLKSRTCPCSYFLVPPQVILERRRSAVMELQGEEVELFPARQEEEEEMGAVCICNLCWQPSYIMARLL